MSHVWGLSCEDVSEMRSAADTPPPLNQPLAESVRTSHQEEEEERGLHLTDASSSGGGGSGRGHRWRLDGDGGNVSKHEENRKERKRESKPRGGRRLLSRLRALGLLPAVVFLRQQMVKETTAMNYGADELHSNRNKT